MSTLYVLKLENNKYYVGITNNLEKRYNEHLCGLGTKWTKIYKPLCIESSTDVNTMFDEDNKTKEMMMRYGIDNVRGGSYSSVDLNTSTKQLLENEFKSANNMCYKCGKAGHYSIDCNNGVLFDYLETYKALSLEEIENEIVKQKQHYKHIKPLENNYKLFTTILFLQDKNETKYILTETMLYTLSNMLKPLSSFEQNAKRNIEAYYERYCNKEHDIYGESYLPFDNISLKFFEVEHHFTQYEKAYKQYLDNNDNVETIENKLKSLMKIRSDKSKI